MAGPGAARRGEARRGKVASGSNLAGFFCVHIGCYPSKVASHREILSVMISAAQWGARVMVPVNPWQLDPALWAREAKGYDLDPWQERVLGSADKNQLLLCSRQAGKSTAASLLAAHCALYRPGSLILCLSPSQRQSGELFQKISILLSGAAKDANSKTEVSLPNGSRVLSLPGSADTIRGYSPRLVLLDEAAFAPDDLFAAISPMLAVSRGKLICLTSPNGKRGFFYALWQNATADYIREKVIAEDCPRISPEFLAQEKMVLSADKFEQEYHCAFGDAENAAFANVESIFDDSVEVL